MRTATEVMEIVQQLDESSRGSGRTHQRWFPLLLVVLALKLVAASAVDAAGSRGGQEVRVYFECSGGFANLELRYRADTAELDPAVASQLLEHVNASGLLAMDEDIPAQPTPPDVISYRIDIEQGSVRKSFRMNDVTAPTSVRPLLGFLRKLALEARSAK